MLHEVCGPRLRRGSWVTFESFILLRALHWQVQATPLGSYRAAYLSSGVPKSGGADRPRALAPFFSEN